jgi:hypothetical protein
MKSAGVVVLPLYVAPYTLPLDVNGGGPPDWSNDSVEPYVSAGMWINADGKKNYISAQPFPFYYGYVANKQGTFGSGSKVNFFYDGVNVHTVNNVYQGAPAGYTWMSGTVPFKGNGDTQNVVAPLITSPRWPINFAGLQNATLFAVATGLIPNAIRMNSGQFTGLAPFQALRVHGRYQRTGALMVGYDTTYTFVGTPEGVMFDIAPPVGLGTDHLVFSKWAPAWEVISSGAHVYMNLSGLLFAPATTLPTWRFWDWNNACFQAQYSAPSAAPVTITIDDDAAISTAFNALTGTMVQNSRNFFMANLNVQRFPGQNHTPIIFDPVNGRYWLVQFIPHHPDAVKMMSSNSSAAEYKLSGGGYILGLDNSGSNGNTFKVFHTQSLSLDYNLNTMLGTPYSLPCFNPCIPNLTIGA